ncbi:MAG: hypothetical protein Q8P19_00655, partial [bacterium]|nr:hypothetical protein [bacterium]
MSIGAVAARIWHYGRWVLLGIVLFLVALAIVRIPAVTQKEKTADAVAFIKSRHITMADVDGQHLPPPPDPAEVDATVEGIDANQNGIRDDVELAIFKKYPNDARIRAAELQYAMTEQMYLTQVFNTETWKAVAE